jgi:hypothetical protein
VFSPEVVELEAVTVTRTTTTVMEIMTTKLNTCHGHHGQISTNLPSTTVNVVIAVAGYLVLLITSKVGLFI